MKKTKNIVLDGIFLILIVFVGWFLIGYYLNYNYLSTGYQDWIYHAFRIKSIQEWGIVSWDHKWANGINYWRSYQYIPHLLTLYTAKLFNIGITNAMMLWTVVVFIYLRIAIYLLLRHLGNSKASSLLIVFVSFAIEQQWFAIKDFSIYLASAVIPIYLLIYTRAFSNSSKFIVLGSVSGLAWSIHPVLGVVLSIITGISVAIRTKMRTLVSFLTPVFMILSMLPYIAPYLLVGYKFSNPFYSSIGFISNTLILPHFGMGLALFVLFVAGGFILVFTTIEKVWARTLYLLLVMFYVVIQFAKDGSLPDFLNILQLQRSVYFLSLISLLPLASAVEYISSKFESKFYLGVVSVFLAVLLVNSIVKASEQTAASVNQIHTPISHLESLEVQGSVYYHDDSEASYFSDSDLRLTGSYNEHLLPSPLSTRFKQIMSGGKSHLIVSERQIDLINKYSKVLGVEYLILPFRSPISKSLLSSETGFIYEDDVEAGNSKYSVFRNKENIIYAYAMERSLFDTSISMSLLGKPDLNSASYDVWDKEVENVYDVISSENTVPLPLEFVNTDELHVTIARLSEFEDPVVLITQSYDENWKVVGTNSKTIVPTSLRFMMVDLVSVSSDTLILENSWPSWHWPVQYFGFGSVLVSGVAVGVYGMIRKEEHAI